MTLPPRWSRTPDASAAAAIGIVALASRLALAGAVPVSPPVSDMVDYWERAIHIATQGRLYDNSWRMPGYPAALAAVFALGSGPSLEAARLFNACAGAAVAVLAYWLARRTASARPALLAALAVALYPSLVIYTTFIATEAVVCVPLLGALIAATYSSRRAAAAAGVCAALATLMRPAGIVLLPAIVAAFARSGDADGRSRWTLDRAALVIALFALAMAPWWIHNARLHGRFVPLDTTGGINLLIGSGPLANGHWDWAPVLRLHTEYLPGVDHTTPAGSDRAAALAMTHIRAHPGSVLRLTPAKLGALVALEGREHAYLYSFGYFGALDTRVLQAWAFAILLSFPLLVVAALGGCVVRDGVASRVLLPCLLFLAASTAMHVISFGDPRFHLPLVPVLAVLATGLADVKRRIVPWRAVVAAIVLVWLALVWRAQLATYLAALMELTQPGGWNAQLSFDDLL